jgi:GGDEF domain-containing protein
MRQHIRPSIHAITARIVSGLWPAHNAQRATVARIGGEQFSIILPHDDEASAAHLARSALDKVRALYIAHETVLIAT